MSPRWMERAKGRKPKISVILPVYNAERHLRRCLESILEQDWPYFEIIVIDDGSTDSSPDVLRSYEGRYGSQLQVIRSQNQGANRARNLGLLHARADYVLFVDSDDFIEPELCRVLHAKAIQGAADIVLCAAYDVYEDAESRCTWREVAPTRVRADNFRVIEEKAELFRISPFPWAKLFRKQSIEGLQFQDLSARKGNAGQFSDIVFVVEACCRAERIGVVEQPLYNYRRTAGGGLSSGHFDVVRAFGRIVESAFEGGYLETMRDEIEFLCICHFFHRYPRLLRFTGNRSMKIEFLITTQAFLRRNFPSWRRNVYLSRSSVSAGRVVRLYGRRNVMALLIWIRDYAPRWVLAPLLRRIEQTNLFTEDL